jgi:hypothetical protein
VAVSTTTAYKYNAQITDKPKVDFTCRIQSKKRFAPLLCLSLQVPVGWSATRQSATRQLPFIKQHRVGRNLTASSDRLPLVTAMLGLALLCRFFVLR